MIDHSRSLAAGFIVYPPALYIGPGSYIEHALCFLPGCDDGVGCGYVGLVFPDTYHLPAGLAGCAPDNYGHYFQSGRFDAMGQSDGFYY